MPASVVFRFRLGDRLSTWRHRRRLQRELGALSDRQLDDLGVLRHELPEFVRGCSTRD